MLLVEDAEGEGEGGLEAGDAVGGALELDLFFVAGVGGVVGGDAVDGAVEEGGDDGLTVGLGAEGRVHLGVGVVGQVVIQAAGGYLFFGEGEVVRGGFAGDVEALFLGFADGAERGGCGDVLDVEVGAEFFFGFDVAEELDVALDDAGLGFDGHAAEAEAEGERAGVHAGAGAAAGVFGVLGDG